MKNEKKIVNNTQSEYINIYFYECLGNNIYFSDKD